MNKTTYEQELEKNGTLIYTTVGMSMRPFLRSGQDLMVIERRENGRFRSRDVVLYRRRSGKYVLHRIMRVRKDDYVLCGDNCWNLEPGIRDDQILGVLTAVIRDEKRMDVNAPGYRCLVFLWWMLYPLRACVFYIRFLVGKLWARIKSSVS
jgi:hypothetical protein